MNKKSSFDEISELISTAVKNLEPDKNIKVYPIWKNWKEIVGEKTASKSNPLMIRGNILIIEVENSVWMNEIQFQKEEILEKIKKVDLKVEKIKFLIKK
jgi:predicted nucleic acid-binding Zn ribbon protein